jgi:hypothetical protein
VLGSFITKKLDAHIDEQIDDAYNMIKEQFTGKSEDGFMCAKYPEAHRTFDWCEKNCPKYYSCDTIALEDDKLKEGDGEE